MMKVAVIENGVVTHLWEVPALDCYGDIYVLVEAPDWVKLGANWDGQKFTNPINPQIKTDMWEAIKGERDRRTQGGYPVSTWWFHSDAYSLAQQQGLILAAMQAKAAGADMSAPLSSEPWKTMSGEKIVMTGALALQLLPAAIAQQAAIYAVAETHKAAMEASTDPGSYDFSTGWPKIFGEA